MANKYGGTYTGTFKDKLQTHPIREWVILLERSTTFICRKLLEGEKKDVVNPIDFVISEADRCHKFGKQKPTELVHKELYNRFIFGRSKCNV